MPDHGEHDRLLRELIDDLRQLHAQAGYPSLRRMAATAHYSHTALSGVLAGGRLPSLDLTLGFVRACGGDERVWRERWTQVRAQRGACLPGEHLPGLSGPMEATCRPRERSDSRQPALPEDGDAVGTESGSRGDMAAGHGVPRQLPITAMRFVGRSASLAAMTSLLDRADGPAAAPVIMAIGGTAGVGKTALAVHWARSVARRFPDGQLYVNLRGFDPSGMAVETAEAVRQLLDGLGVPAERIPASMDAQAALYRSVLAGRRVLIVLDNAADERQVRPLLPACPSCAVVITSRSQLGGLIAIEGAHPIGLDLLSQAEARDLLASYLGDQRTAAEPAAVDELIGLCARLPLALVILAARLVLSHFPLAARADELRGTARWLSILDAGDPAASIRAAFSWSYAQLSPAAARMFRLLGIHPGPDSTIPGAAALAGVDPGTACDLLGQLARAHLLTENAPGRFTFHDLLRTYATEQEMSEDTDEERRIALSGLFHYYLAGAAAAMDTLCPAEKHRRPDAPNPPVPLPPLGTAGAAMAWLDADCATLAAITSRAADGWPGIAVRFAETLYRYLDISGRYSTAITVHTTAQAAAHRLGNLSSEANAMLGRGFADWRLGRCKQAADWVSAALQLYEQAGDLVGQARALGNLGFIHTWLDCYEPAMAELVRALAIFRETADGMGQGGVLNKLGVLLRRQDRYSEAADHHRRALQAYREIGERSGEADALACLGITMCRLSRYQEAAAHCGQAREIYAELGEASGLADTLNCEGTILSCRAQWAEAAECHREALGIYQQIGDHGGQADALVACGIALAHLGSHEEALASCRQALTIYTEIGRVSGEAAALNTLAELADMSGEPARARALHQEALAAAGRIGSRHELARAHAGLARAYRTAGDHDQGDSHRKRALAIYAELGTPDTGHVRSEPCEHNR